MCPCFSIDSVKWYIREGGEGDEKRQEAGDSETDQQIIDLIIYNL